MTTDGPDPPPCEKEIWKKGTVVLITAEVSSNRMERWVKQVAEYSGQRVDWHFAGGRAVVKALGDLDRVQAVCLDLREDLDRLYRESVENYLLPGQSLGLLHAPWHMPPED